jgi:diguanylate cyclase (GGDEF)-like protein
MTRLMSLDLEGSESPSARAVDAERHNSNVINAQVLRYVAHVLGPQAVTDLLAAAGEHRDLDQVVDPTGWTSFDQSRRILQAAADVLGGPSGLRAAGAWYASGVDDQVHDARAVWQTLGGPAGILSAIAEAATKYSTVVSMEAEEVGTNHGVVVARSVPGFPRYRLLCELTAGLLSQAAQIFGLPPSRVVEEQCEVRGDSLCRYRVTWDGESSDPEARLNHLHKELAGLKARFNTLKATVGELVSGHDFDTVLEGIINRAALTIRAPQYVLAVRTHDHRPVRVHSIGLDDTVTNELVGQLLCDEPDEQGGSMLIVDVRSGRRNYGRLAAMNSAGRGFFPEERSILAAYAELAAAALDSATALEEAREQAATSRALLDLAQALARVTSREEVAVRLADAVPQVVGSLSSSVLLWDGERLSVAAAHGIPAAAEVALRHYRVRLDEAAALREAIERREPYFVDITDTDGPLRQVLEDSGVRSFTVVPIFAGDTFYGIVNAGSVVNADRLRLDPDIVARLTGLAHQAATAFQNADLLDHVRHQALHDPLTGTPNQRLLEDRVESAIAASRRTGTPMALLFLDLDRFKNVNDTLGHAVGDALLCQVTARLRNAVRETDTIARLGGDECAILLPAISDIHDAEQVATKVLAALQQSFPVAQHELFISASIGIAAHPYDADHYTDLLKAADTAMYSAKAAGRGTFRCYSPTMPVKNPERLGLEADLHLAVERDELRVVFQPQIDLRTMQVVRAEALVRWQHPERGLVPPDEFIPLAEETGLITEIDSWVLREACRHVALWREAGLPPLRISANVSDRDLRDPMFASRVAANLEANDVPADHLELEITERVAETVGDEMAPVLEQLHDMGVHLAIDDFGTGNSAFSRLMRGKVDTLKIDKSFLEDVRASDDDAPLVTAMISLGHSLGMEVVAEGVETAEQGAFLRRNGCDLAQGYFFSRPVPAQDFEDLVRRFGT